jgi:hypothetical protein
MDEVLRWNQFQGNTTQLVRAHRIFA